MSIQEKFSLLATDNAPGQEIRQQSGSVEVLLRGDALEGVPVDFSHGDVDAHEPTPGSLDLFNAGFKSGGRQAYTEYRGDREIRDQVAARLSEFTGAPVDAADGLIVTPGTQGALFLAVASCVTHGTKMAIVQPDYFTNRKLVEFFEGEMVPVQLHYDRAVTGTAGIDLTTLEDAFKAGAEVFLFSNPSNPTGVVYSSDEILEISKLADRYGVTVIVDQLYSRLLYDGSSYTHLRAQDINPANVVTLMGPSKTESLSGFRLGVAFGSAEITGRMEKLQSIMSLRAPGYSQAVLRSWFNEPEGWMKQRISRHQAIRDDLVGLLGAGGEGDDRIRVRTPEAGSYVFPRLPKLAVSTPEFVRILRLQAGVTTTPGLEFGPNNLDSVRLNFSQDHRAAVAAVERMLELVERYRA